MNKHSCLIPGGSVQGAHGHAVDECFEDAWGRFIVSNGEYSSTVNYCPYCGAKAPKQIGEPINEEFNTRNTSGVL